ncbi:MAG: FAD-binding oxidoreductase [Spongiibacteraceae bacterium]|jgi:4-cresol dehydrogenase (hydroxylating)|nr:FAD-binding oxidoreductase [Spongiibacteraceae bacterium]
MSRAFPPGLSEQQFERALAAFAAVIGSEAVLSTDSDRHAYRDIYDHRPQDRHLPGAALAPASVEEVQAIVRIASEHRVPLWPISRGKNMGYGGSAPRLAGTVVLDLSRMNRILDIDVKHGHVLLEPGVTFFDLFAVLQENDIPLWLSVPSNSLGSVVGNALDRGNGYTPYGDHASKVCGMELVMPDATLLRTGMGALPDSVTWQLYKYGYGPSWDQVFMQSNYGIVTKMGLWLMPEPESTLTLKMQCPNEEDIGWIIDAVGPLRRRNIIQHNPNIGNFMQFAMTMTSRSDWYDGAGAVPAEVEAAIMQKLGLGWWHVNLTLYGYDEVNEFHAGLVRKAFAEHTSQPFEVHKWHRGQPLDIESGAGVPMTLPLNMVNWAGGRGGHLEFSPVLPQDGARCLRQLQRSRALFRQYGVDYYGSYTVGERHVNKINMIVFNKDDADQTQRCHQLFHDLVAEGAADGYGEYRTHLSYMDTVAATYSFNDHALLRLNEQFKDLVDPKGIIAPGKQGIWPKTLRERKT